MSGKKSEENRKKFLLMHTGLLSGSIVANAKSLIGQISDYGYEPTEAQVEELSDLEKKLHDLVQRITNPSKGVGK